MKVSIEDKKAKSLLTIELLELLMTNTNHLPLAIVCIGTDRATGDCLGPLVGTALKKKKDFVEVYGTLENPIHAQNLHTIKHLKDTHFIIAIDASLGKQENIRYATIENTPMQPGIGVGKELFAIGDISITGIVNFKSHMNMTVLQNTRLYHVVELSDMITKVITKAVKQYKLRNRLVV